MATVRRIRRWPKFEAGTPLDTLRAELNDWMRENDNAVVGGAKGNDALDASAELTTNVKGSATIAGKPAVGVAATYAAEFMEAFDATPADWITLAGTPSYASAGTGQTGGKALRQTGTLSLAFPQGLPYDASKLHRLRTRAKNVSGTGTFTFGLQALDANGLVIGTYAVAASGAVPGGSYVEYTGWVKGFATPTQPAPDPKAPSGMPTGTVAIRPYVVLNGGAPAGVTDLDYLSYERQDEEATDRTYNALIPKTDPRWSTGARTVNNAVDTGAVQDVAITEPKHADDSVSTRVVQSDIVLTGRVESTVDPTIFLDLRSTLAPTDKVFSHPAFTLLMNGTATFSGTVSATTFTATTATFAGGLVAQSLTSLRGIDVNSTFNPAPSILRGAVNVDGTGGSATLQIYAATLWVRSNSVCQIDCDLQHSGTHAGFFGTTAVTQRSLTYSRATETAAVAQIRLALAALGLVADNTVP